MRLRINGEDWEIQYVNMMIPLGFEVNPVARLIRIEFTEIPEVFGNRVARAVAEAVAIPVLFSLD
jgi:hypothetical protein